MQEIRILEAITPSAIGGAEMYVTELCHTLIEMGVHTEVFCPKGRPFVRYAEEKGLQVTNWKTSGKIDPGTVLRLTHLIKSAKIDVIHTHLSTACLLGAFAARFAGIPSVAHVHGLNSANCFKHSTVIVAVSDAVKQHICAQGIPEDKVHVIHNGIDLRKFVPSARDDARLRVGYDTTSPIIGIFGRLSPEKGQSVAIHTLPTLLEKFPDLKMVFLGRGKDLDALKATAEGLGVADSVRFEGFIPDIRDYVSACDLVVMPSHKEGLPLVAIEAMAMQRPLVASNVGGMKEVVLHGETGFIVQPNDPATLAEHIERVLAGRSLAEQMGKRGRERVEANFELQTQTRLLLSVMDTVISNR